MTREARRGQQVPLSAGFLFQIFSIGVQAAKVPPKTVKLTSRLTTMDKMIMMLKTRLNLIRSSDRPIPTFSRAMAIPLQKTAKFEYFIAARTSAGSSEYMVFPYP